ncbi:hypothetical protein [Sagittula salina]|uniref:Uncharacterized protein n=1 Tax=Sagittula salina TaxID=2820268 RepID=A0A940S073_9RHOB|nr:hypothetical protein [Sagittula salina]MBP0481742.1 hypothetical protein [Sagittula salina]
MSHPKPAPATDHWSDRFPRLLASEPRLDLLRYALHGLEDQNPEHPLARLSETLTRALGQVPEIAHPGTPEQSFDERWLLAAFEALRRADLRWYQFLLRSRMRAGDAARAHFALMQAQVWLEARL